MNPGEMSQMMDVSSLDHNMFTSPIAEDGSGSRDMTSRYRGVTYNKKSRKWQAVINTGGKHIHLGTFTIEEDAATAFDKAALIVRGSKAKINFELSLYTDAEGNVIQDKVVNDKLIEAQDPNRKIRAKPTKRNGIPITPGGSMGGGSGGNTPMSPAALVASLTASGMMGALMGNMGGAAGMMGMMAAAGAAQAAVAGGAAGGSGDNSSAGDDEDWEVQQQREMSRLASSLQQQQGGNAAGTGSAAGTQLSPNAALQSMLQQAFSVGGAAGGPGVGQGSGGVGSEAAMWTSVDQIEKALPEGAVLDSIIPHIETRVLGVLYSTPLNGMVNACLWRDGQLMGHMPSSNREEARKYIVSMMELASSFNRINAPSKAVSTQQQQHLMLQQQQQQQQQLLSLAGLGGLGGAEQAAAIAAAMAAASSRGTPPPQGGSNGVPGSGGGPPSPNTAAAVAALGASFANGTMSAADGAALEEQMRILYGSLLSGTGTAAPGSTLAPEPPLNLDPSSAAAFQQQQQHNQTMELAAYQLAQAVQQELFQQLQQQQGSGGNGPDAQLQQYTEQELAAAAQQLMQASSELAQQQMPMKQESVAGSGEANGDRAEVKGDEGGTAAMVVVGRTEGGAEADSEAALALNQLRYGGTNEPPGPPIASATAEEAAQQAHAAAAEATQKVLSAEGGLAEEEKEEAAAASAGGGRGIKRGVPEGPDGGITLEGQPGGNKKR